MATTYYFWGKRPPTPTPFQGQGQEGRKVVFLTKTPDAVYFSHGKRGNLYAVEVPARVEKQSKPHWYDGAQQLIIPDQLWKQCTLLGRVSEKKIDRLLKRDRWKTAHNEWAPIERRTQGEKIREFYSPSPAREAAFFKAGLRTLP